VASTHCLSLLLPLQQHNYLGSITISCHIHHTFKCTSTWALPILLELLCTPCLLRPCISNNFGINLCWVQQGVMDSRLCYERLQWCESCMLWWLDWVEWLGDGLRYCDIRWYGMVVIISALAVECKFMAQGSNGTLEHKQWFKVGEHTVYTEWLFCIGQFAFLQPVLGQSDRTLIFDFQMNFEFRVFFWSSSSG